MNQNFYDEIESRENELRLKKLESMSYVWNEIDVKDKEYAEKYKFDLNDFPKNIYLNGREIYNDENREIVGLVLFHRLHDDTIVIKFMNIIKPPKNILNMLEALVLSEFPDSELKFDMD